MPKSKKYTKEERNYIIENYGKLSALEIAIKLKKTVKNIYDYASLLRSQGEIDVYLDRWGDRMRMMDFVAENYGKLSVEEIAKKLKKPRETIYQCAWALRKQGRITVQLNTNGKGGII